eukprot:399465-Pelagomonas_calceolata.AAC.1
MKHWHTDALFAMLLRHLQVALEAGGAEETLSTSNKEKGTHWLKRAASLMHQKAGTKELVVIWRVTGSSQLRNLAVRIVFAFNCVPSGNYFVCVLC